MKRVLPAVFAAGFLACATTPSTTAPVTTPPAATTTTPAPAADVAAAPCDSSIALLNSVLWVQSSAEYRAAALQTFAGARRGLDNALNNPFAKGALEETTNDPGQPPAIIFDLDETVLDNGAFESQMLREHKTYDAKEWKEWTAKGAAADVPGAAEFLAYAKKRGVTTFYITNRDISEEAGTRKNLETLNYPLDPNVDTLLMQGEKGWTTSDKSPRRAFVAASYRILNVIGDDLNDFASASGKTVAERTAITDSVRSWWGEIWFIVPNPMYGSWEKAAMGGSTSGTPCEQLQKKVDALR